MDQHARAQRIFEANASEMLADAPAAPTFTNATGRPVRLATWQRAMEGLSEYRHVTVAAGETSALPPSCTDEFIVETERYERLGKFRLSPAADRRYSWMECDEHDITWQTQGLPDSPGASRPREYCLVPARPSPERRTR
jgi:hypothetical protein